MAEADQDGYGRPGAPLAGNEVETLLGFLDYQRATLAWRCAGLDDDQLRLGLHPRSMTLAGLLKHLARVEDNWFSDVVGGGDPLEPSASMSWAAEWESCAADTGEELRRTWALRVEASRRVVAAQLHAGPTALDATHPAWGGQGRPRRCRPPGHRQGQPHRLIERGVPLPQDALCAQRVPERQSLSQLLAATGLRVKVGATRTCTAAWPRNRRHGRETSSAGTSPGEGLSDRRPRLP